MECPVCGSSNVTASHRRGTENLFRYLLPRAPYRCKDCWSRFWRTENPFKTTASKLGALAALLLVAALVSLPFWGPAGKKPDSETPEESYTLPVPTHRSAQRSYDADAGRPAPAPSAEPAPRAEPETPEDSAAPTYARAEPPAPAADSAAPAPMAGASAETEAGPGTPAGEIPPIAAGPTRPDGGESASTPAVSQAGTADSSDATDAAEDTESATPAESAERTEAEGADSEASADAAIPEPAAPESAAADAASEPAEVAEPAAVSPDAEAPSPATGELPPAPPGPRTLTALAPRSGGGQFELAGSAGGPVKETHIFSLSDPPKLVIDLAGKWDRKVKSPVAVDGPLVKQVRLGNHPEYLRLVLDLAETGSHGGPVGHEFVPTAEGFRLLLFPEGGS